MNDHMYIGELESTAIAPTGFEQFVARCEKLCAFYLHADHEGKPSFDGDQETDGYSLDCLDWLVDQYVAGKRPMDVVTSLAQQTTKHN